MWKNAQKLVIPLSTRLLRQNVKSYQMISLFKSPVFTSYVPKYTFAKQGKKKLETIAHQQERAEADAPAVIDLNDYEKNIKKHTEQFKNEIAKIRLGKVSPLSFENVRVLAFGEKRPLAELVQFIPKSANTIAMNVYDESVVTDIIKTLESGKDSYAIKQEGKTITCTLVGGNTKEAKEGLMKQVKQELEKAKDALKKERNTSADHFKKIEKFSQKDVIVKANKELQNLNDKYTAELEKIYKTKEKEIMG